MRKQTINKIGLLHIQNKKLLVVYKSDIGLYITLGGKIKSNETDKECLDREIHEEIGCKIENHKYFATFRGVNENNNQINLKCYIGELKGRIILNPSDTIRGYYWIDSDYKKKNLPLGSILTKQILPKLVERGLL